MTVPAPVNEGSDTTMPPLEASYHVRVSPELTVAAAVKVWPLSHSPRSPLLIGGGGVASMVKVTGVKVLLIQPVESLLASA